MNITRILVLLFVAMTATACTEVVPVGFAGMRKDSDGLDGTVLEPGRHSCGFRCELVLLETREMLNAETMSIMCEDDLNISMDVETRSRLKVKDAEGIKEVLNKQPTRGRPAQDLRSPRGRRYHEKARLSVLDHADPREPRYHHSGYREGSQEGCGGHPGRSDVRGDIQHRLPEVHHGRARAREAA